MSSGARNRGGQRKRYKDTLKQTLKLTYINTETLHALAENRTVWRQAVKKGIRSFEAERLKARADKRQKRKAKEAQDIKVQQIPVSEPIHHNTDIIEIDKSTTILAYTVVLRTVIK